MQQAPHHFSRSIMTKKNLSTSASAYHSPPHHSLYFHRYFFEEIDEWCGKNYEKLWYFKKGSGNNYPGISTDQVICFSRVGLDVVQLRTARIRGVLKYAAMKRPPRTQRRSARQVLQQLRNGRKGKVILKGRFGPQSKKSGLQCFLKVRNAGGERKK